MRKNPVLALSCIALSCMTSVWAAQPVDLSHQPVSVLQSLTANHMASSQSGLQQMSSATDFNQTTHVRLQQTYAGYPVWGSDFIVHVPRGGNVSLAHLATNKNATMNGVIYQNLNQDLNNTPAYIFSAAQATKAIQQAVDLYQQQTGSKQVISDSKSKLMVYVDQDNKAHWAYLISFMAHSGNAMPEKPTYIMDAMTFKVYKQWNNLQTVDEARGGGFGGNPKRGKFLYDGLANNLPELTVERDASATLCYLENADVTVKDVRKSDAISQFTCAAEDSEHNNVYWNADLGSTNGAYSPDNDALYAGQVIKGMYQKWYNVPVLTDGGKPMMLVMRVHEDMENAYWDGKQMTFGDGGSEFYPLVSLGVGAHEISHGFTEQHSNLVYDGQSGGLNESFSDMAAQAAEFYSYGHNSWEIGPEIMKADGKALRYMDEPTKDCNGRPPGFWCSISNVKNYYPGLNVHYSSGVFNKVFYLIGTAKDWDTKKAFDVMVQANQHYWTSNATFQTAACGVVKATQDYKYDLNAVKNAMNQVGIDVSGC
jgi:pseudolysin